VREVIAELGTVRAFHEQMKKDLRESCEQSYQLMKYRWVLILLKRQCSGDFLRSNTYIDFRGNLPEFRELQTLETSIQDSHN
jgi:hypothetical protein